MSNPLVGPDRRDERIQQLEERVADLRGVIAVVAILAFLLALHADNASAYDTTTDGHPVIIPAVPSAAWQGSWQAIRQAFRDPAPCGTVTLALEHNDATYGANTIGCVVAVNVDAWANDWTPENRCRLLAHELTAHVYGHGHTTDGTITDPSAVYTAPYPMCQEVHHAAEDEVRHHGRRLRGRHHARRAHHHHHKARGRR